MDRSIKVWHLVIALAALFGSMVSAWVSLNKDQAATNVRLEILERDKQELKNDVKDIKSQNTQILVILQNKQDRKP